MCDDFAHYVIGTNFSTRSSRWLNLRLDEDMWQSSDRRLQALLRDMNKSERRAWEEYEEQEAERFAGGLTIQFVDVELGTEEENSVGGLSFDEDTEREIEADRSRMLAAMTDSIRSRIEAIWQSQSEEFPGLDLSVIQRYIVWRVFDLGWTVELFGDFDSITIGYEGREANKAERVGKKYQWIAYHEILAHLADNYQYSPDFYGSGQVFQGAWQGSYRDIDPSSMLASKPGGTGWHGQCLSWWAQTAYEDWQEDASHQTWLDTESDFPQVEGLLYAVRPDDSTGWLILEGSFLWEQPHSADVEPYDNPKRQIRTVCQAYIIRAGDADKFVEWARDVDFWGRWMPEPPNVLTSDMFLGEFSWSTAFNCFNDSLDSDYRNDGWSNARGKCPVQVLITSIHYLAEPSTFDCSVDDGYSLYLPYATIIEELGLKWTGAGADFMDEQGRVVAFDPTAHEDGANALLIREDVLKQFLGENYLALCWTVVGEKMVVGAGDRNSQSMKFRKLTGAYILADESIERIHQRSSYW